MTLTNQITNRGENVVLRARAENEFERGDLVFYWPGGMWCERCDAEIRATDSVCPNCESPELLPRIVRYAPPKRPEDLT